MPDLETRLRTALHAVDPDVMSDDDAWVAWAARLDAEPASRFADDGGALDPSTADRDLVEVDAGDGAGGAGPTGRSRRRLALAIGVAAAIATGGLLATSPLRQSADGPATAPSDGIPRLVLDQAPAGMVVDAAYDNDLGGTPDRFVVGLRSTSGPRASVQIEAWPSTGATSTGDPVTIDGHPGTVQSGLREMTNVLWADGTVVYQLLASGPQMTDPAFAVSVAGTVRQTGVNGGGPTSFTLSRVPVGFAVTYEGTEAALTPPGGYIVNFRAPGPTGDTSPELTLRVAPRGLGADRLGDIYGLEPTTVAGRPGFVGPVGFDAYAGPGSPTSMMALYELGDAVVRVSAYNLGRTQFLDSLARLRIVSDAEWHRLVGAKLDPGLVVASGPLRSSAGTTFPTVPTDTGSGPTTSLGIPPLVA